MRGSIAREPGLRGRITRQSSLRGSIAREPGLRGRAPGGSGGGARQSGRWCVHPGKVKQLIRAFKSSLL